jgi:DNA-binding SARP family transcriptional activator
VSDQPEQAIGWLIKGLEMAPSSEALYQSLIRCYLELGQIADAVTSYKKYFARIVLPLKIDPSNRILQLMEDAGLATDLDKYSKK